MKLSTSAALIIASLVACSKSDTSDAPASYAGPKFELLTPERTGIDFVGHIDETGSKNYFLINYLYIGGAVAVADFDKDGLEDLYIVSNTQSNQLYRNLGDFKFTDLTASSQTALPGLVKTGVTIVDINQDGFPDIYQCVTGELTDDRRNRLLINNGDLTFREAAAEYGLDLENPSTSAAFFDYDRDGDLDVYVINRPVDYHQTDKVRIKEVNGKRARVTEPDDELESDLLLAFQAGKYVDVSKRAGISNRAYALSVSLADVDGDGWQDIYVANDYIEPDMLYINQQDGTFRDQIAERFGHMSHFSMGADIGDLNGDGYPEIMTLDMLADGHERQINNASPMQYSRYATLDGFGFGKQIMRNMLQSGHADGSFSEIACLANVYKTDWSWGPLFFDADNDGLLDIFISNGFLRDVGDMDFTMFRMDSAKQTGLTEEKVLGILDLMPSKKLPNYLYQNRGDFAFDNIAEQAGLGQATFSNGAVYADLNNDGKLDLIVHNNDDPIGIYANRSTTGNYLTVTLTGNAGNLDAVGASVKVFATGQSFERHQQPTKGFFSSQSQRLNFGLGTATHLDSIVVAWSDATFSVLKEPKINSSLVITQKDAQRRAGVGQVKLQQAESLPVIHQQLDKHHLQASPLLYRGFATEGPVVAVADLNADGLDDLYFGGSLGYTGKMLTQTGLGGWVVDSSAFLKDAPFEDGSALFFDADGDGDLDLFVGSSGVNLLSAPHSLLDRLYINDGGKFRHQPAALPTESLHTSAAAATDLDGDGDLDLLVAHHSNPNNFPLQELNSIWLNERGTFSKSSIDILPGWEDLGMINDIHLADLDQDGRLEILALGEWTPLTIFSQVGKQYKNIASELGITKSSGLWYAVTTLDFDGDGDLDLLAGNLGLNTRFEVKDQFPLLLAGYDLDGNQQYDPIVFGSKGTDRYLPYLRREEFVKQVPAYAKRYPRFAGFATADMGAILAKFDQAELFKAETLTSTLYVNENGSFKAVPLPGYAQRSAIRDFAILDLNQDGAQDAICVGNIFDMEIKGGPLDASVGAILLGGKQGGMTLLPNEQLQFWAAGDTREVKLIRTARGVKALVTRNQGPATLHALELVNPNSSPVMQ